MLRKSPAWCRAIWALLAVLVLSAALGGWWLVKRMPDEPHNRGHPLSYWVQQYESAAGAGQYLPVRLSPEAVAAVRGIGTNALPTMIRWMTRPESGVEAKIVTWAHDGRIPLWARRFLVPAYAKSYRPGSAIMAFRALGPAAKDAVPVLARMLNSPNNAPWAVMALCAVGSQGVKALEEAFPQIGDGIQRANIINQFEVVVTPELEGSFAPFLARVLGEDSHAAVRMSAARVLGMLTNSPMVAVPALTKALQDRDGGVRFTASASLGRFGPAATSAIDSLQAALNDSNPQVRLDAARALRSIQGTGGTKDEKPR